MLLMYYCLFLVFVFFFKQKTAYEMRISDWSSDVCSSDLASVKIASGMPKVTATTIGVSALGRMWRASRRPKPAPSPRAASTYSFSLIEIGRASCRERVCQYVSISVVAVSLKKKINNRYTTQPSSFEQSTEQNYNTK